MFRVAVTVWTLGLLIAFDGDPITNRVAGPLVLEMGIALTVWGLLRWRRPESRREARWVGAVPILLLTVTALDPNYLPGRQGEMLIARYEPLVRHLERLHAKQRPKIAQGHEPTNFLSQGDPLRVAFWQSGFSSALVYDPTGAVTRQPATNALRFGRVQRIRGPWYWTTRPRWDR